MCDDCNELIETFCPKCGCIFTPFIETGKDGLYIVECPECEAKQRVWVMWRTMTYKKAFRDSDPELMEENDMQGW